MAERLDPVRLPLWGSRLIEASAGTGKTWTIAALMLRLVLGHGGEAAFGRALVPGEILVMTFTRAATRELSDRIRARLLEAARCFRGEMPPGADPLLAALLDAYPAGEARAAAAWRLALAAEAMDDAAVHTIDAWCQRMLREHAFDSGCLFDEELVADEAGMLAEAARDYWRRELYGLSGPALEQALAAWPDLDALVHDARQIIGHELPPGAGAGSLGELIGGLNAARAQRLRQLKQGWAERAQRMRDWLDAHYDAPVCPFPRSKLTKKNYGSWLARVADWAADEAAEAPDLGSGAARLAPDALQALFDPRLGITLPPAFAELSALLAELAALPAPATALRLHAAAGIAARLDELKQQAGRYGFDDMLQRLDRALDPAHNGDAALRLRDRIVARYPAALVDEFQDTSPLQLRILDRLYRIADNDRSCALLLIGDPKQSIYAFRGADIHSYLAARRATAGRHHVLGTNHRSTPGLVAAVNHLFGAAEARPGGGAFMLRDPAAPDDDPLPFLAVEARASDERLVAGDGVAVPAATLVLDAEPRTGDDIRRLFAGRCAERIVGLLNDPGAGFSTAGGRRRRLQPADIAVLVRTGREAAAVRLALRRRGVASVYLSDQDSVFRSAEAAELLRLLRAVAEPGDVRLLRAALAGGLLGLSLAELARLAVDETAFERRAEIFRELHAEWRQRGVLAMLRRALHRFGLPALWLGAADRESAAGDGERRLTNVLHLAELLQAASAQLDGEQALIRWLAAQVDGGGSDADEQIVRLESDADLVQVVTVHKSKGLEYALVFLPYACSFRAADRAGAAPVVMADAEGRRRLHLQPTAEVAAAADLERLREDLRLLYVALTRARHMLWLGVAVQKDGRNGACIVHRSAFGMLAGGPAPRDADTFAAQVVALALPAPDIAVETAQQPGWTGLQDRGDLPPLIDPLPYAAQFDRRWTVGSYSALVRAVAPPPLLSAAVARDDERAPADASPPAPHPADEAPPPHDAAPAPWHAFPRGPAAGDFLHRQLEWLAGEGGTLRGSLAWRQQLQRRCDQQGYGARAGAVQAWLEALLDTELPPVGTSLSGLTRRLPEMEFWLPSAGLDAAAVDALCRRHLLPGCERPPLPARDLHGMLMGYADLVFEAGGRYWVLDYKSNALGPGDGDYAPAALQAAVAAHRYDVQAALYLVALHRLLRLRLGAGYDPQRHLGGAICFFIRGLRGPARGCQLLAAPPALLDGIDRLLGDGGGGAA